MASRSLLLPAAAVAVLVLALLALVFAPPAALYSYSHTTQYESTIQTNATVHNATFYLPVPEPAVGDPSLGDLSVVTENGTRVTDWNASVVDTEHGPMLRVHADTLAGADYYRLYTFAENGTLIEQRRVTRDELPANMTNKEAVPDPTTYHVFWSAAPASTIETRYPIGNDTFLTPIQDVQSVACEYDHGDTDACYTYSTLAFASFRADGPVALGVGATSYSAWNEWGWGLSNGFNNFDATTDAAVYTRTDQGWRVLDGRLHAGQGSYRRPGW